MTEELKKLPDIEDVKFLLGRAAVWADLAGSILDFRHHYLPVEIAKSDPLLAAAIEVFDWMSRSQAGRQALRDLNLEPFTQNIESK